MVSLEQSLADLHARGAIDYQEVMHNANDSELAAQLAVRKNEKKGIAGLFSGSR